MYTIDHDSSDEEYVDEYDSWSSGFDRVKKNRKENSTIVQELDPIDKERLIMNACISGDLTTVQQYYTSDSSTFDLNHILVGNFTALMQAASYSQNHIVKYLLDLGANPNTKSDGITALMCACSSSSIHKFALLECIKHLIDKKATVNIGDRYGTTPLMRAVMCNKIEAVNMLLKFNVNVEMRNNIGRTAIFFAVENNLPEMTQILVDANCSLDVIDRRGYTILMIAKSNACEKVLEVLKQVFPTEEEEENVISVSDGLNWCDMLPNTSVARNKPAYSHELTSLLIGMNCDKLEPLMTNLDLASFLTLNEESLKTIGVDLPYERLKVLVGLQSFHMHGWKTQCVMGLTDKKDKNFDSLKTLDILASHMKNITVLKSSIDYCSQRTNNAIISVDNRNVKMKLLKEINYCLKDIEMLKRYITKINKNNLVPADLILPNNPKSKRSFKKTKIIVYSVSFAVLTAIFTMKHDIKLDDLYSILPKALLKLF